MPAVVSLPAMQSRLEVVSIWFYLPSYQFDLTLFFTTMLCLIFLAKKKKQTVKRMPWTTEEKSALHVSLGRYFYTKGQLPGKRAIMECLEKHSSRLANRSWRNVKDFIRNHQLKM